jgi:hypothetical protein
MTSRSIHLVAIASAVTLGVLGAGMVPAALAATPGDPRCDVRPSNLMSPVCPVVPEIVTYRKECPKDGPWIACEPPNAPPAAQIDCTAYQGNVWCEAWPQGYKAADFSYYWTISGSLTPPSSTDVHSPLSTASCTGIRTVKVTVVGKNGASGVASMPVNCNAQ